MLHSFEWYTLVPGLNLLQAHTANAIVIALLILGLGVAFNRRLAARGDDIFPGPRFGVVNFFEMLYEALLGILQDVLGHRAADFVYLLGGLSIFILFSNLLGLIPGFAPPTDSLNTTAACAIIVFVSTHIYGVKTHGIGYLKQFTGPFWWLAWLMVPIEIIGHLARPLSLSLRLFGNLMGDHMVTSLFVFMSVGLTKFIISGSPLVWPFALLSPLIPIVVMLLGLFVAVVQTFVFLLLSMTYIAGAISEHH